MIISTTVTISIFAISFCLFPILLAVFFRYKKFNSIFAVVLLIIYLIVLCIGVFTFVKINSDYVSVSFDYSSAFLNKKIDWSLNKIKFSDFIINIVILMPVGVVVALFGVYKKNNLFPLGIKLLLIGFIIGLSIECGQFFLPIVRSVQLSDVVLNTCSCFFGGMWFLFLLKIMRAKRP